MTAISLQKSNQKILVVGSIYNKMDKLTRAINLSKYYDTTIFNGNICYPFDKVEERLEILDKYLSTNIIYNLGNYDLQYYNQTQNKNIKDWITNKSNIINIDFDNQSRVIIVSGGILPHFTKQELLDNLEISFVSLIKDKPWHQSYNGKLGYVISNNPLTNQSPIFYNFSAQIGNSYQEEVQVYGQEINKYGLQQTILL
jgi:hypothetical protein